MYLKENGVGNMERLEGGKGRETYSYINLRDKILKIKDIHIYVCMYLINNLSGGQGAGSVVKSTYYSCRGPKVDSQNPGWGALNLL